MRRLLVALTLLLGAPVFAQEPSIRHYPSGTTTLTLGPQRDHIRYWPATLRAGLQSYYLMGEATGATRNDSVGGKHLADTLGTVSQVAGKSGNGSQTSVAGNDYLSTTGFVLGPSWTISLWWKNNDAGRAADAIFHILNAAWPNNTQVAIYFGAGLETYALVGDGAAFTFASSSTGALDANFHHTIAWFDAADKTVHISVDGGGESAGAAALAGTPYRTAALVGTGRSTVGGPIASATVVDEVAIWSRVLTPTERATMYGAGVGKFYPF